MKNIPGALISVTYWQRSPLNPITQLHFSEPLRNPPFWHSGGLVVGSAVVVGTLDTVVPGSAVEVGTVDTVVPGSAVEVGTVDTVVPGSAVDVGTVDTVVTGSAVEV